MVNGVFEQGPWMVNGKPLIVKRWNSEIGLEKVEHDKLPIWVKFSKILWRLGPWKVLVLLLAVLAIH